MARCATILAAPPHPLNAMVLILKPNVGLIVVMSSPFNRLTMVVFPALSSPLRDKARAHAETSPRGSLGLPLCRTHLHHKYTHLFFFLLDLLYDRE